MPSPERPPGHNKEREPPPYCRSARFPNEQTSGVAYFSAQRLIFDHKQDCDLSVFRLQLNQTWHVAVLGDPPPPDLDMQLRTIFATGEPAALPSDVLQILQARRGEAIKKGPWVERHYRPGK